MNHRAILGSIALSSWMILSGAAPGAHAADRVDFSYSPPEWQTAICLPDDPHKSLVDKSGSLLYRFGEGGREFGLRIVVEVVERSDWLKQELYSPRIPIVKTHRSADGLRLIEQTFAAPSPVRSDWIVVQVTNTGSEPRILHPKVLVDTPLAIQLNGQRVVVGGREAITSSLEVAGLAKDGRMQLAALSVPAGKTVEFAVCCSIDGTPVPATATVEQAAAYWNNVPLPFGRIAVPDTGIQMLLDSSIRNIWQAREIKKGLPAFQVGPTCYRGLWIVDGAFLLEAATMLGAGQQARGGVAYELTHQKSDGHIEVMKDFSKENGIVLWTCARHARLTQDKAWLESVWPKLERIAESIKRLRRETLQNNSPLDDGLVPPGLADGGIDGIQFEYTNVYWNLAGLRAFAEAADWLGKPERAAVWRSEYEDFFAAFRKAAAQDMKTDGNGHRYLPIRRDGQDLPQRAQWAFCHAVYPGQMFAKDDPLVSGNMAMLKATEREGMVFGTGWDATGIWNYFASFYGHAWLWQGNGRKAAEVLYSYANHAAPVLVWREEQSLKGQRYNKVGDMPHNWASAEFIRLAVHLIALDRNDELHLFEGLPAAWVQPSLVTKIDGLVTPFGKLTMQLRVANDGRTAHLHVEPLTDASCKKIVVHLSGWASSDPNASIELNPKEETDRDIPIAVPKGRAS